MAFCEEQGLPSGETMVHVAMDDYIGILGENEGGCIVIYEIDHPERYCVSVEKSVLQDREFLISTLYRQVLRYKEFMKSERQRYKEETL